MRPLNDESKKNSQNTKELRYWAKLCGSKLHDMQKMSCLMYPVSQDQIHLHTKDKKHIKEHNSITHNQNPHIFY